MSNYDLKIYTENIERKALNQVYKIIKSPAMEGAKIRIMPDVHAGKGCVIGFTATNWKYIIPNIVGVDIGCGMKVVNLGNIDIDYTKFDNIIREFVPSGMNIHKRQSDHILKEVDKLLDELICDISKEGKIRAEYSAGTLGAGNHFIEIDTDEDNNKYLVIHTGSRNLGTIVAESYQKKAIQYCASIAKEINQYIEPDLAFLSNEESKNYLHDIILVQQFAKLNRERIATIIMDKMNWKQLDTFTTIHNYIDVSDNTMRKGSISSKVDEKVLIPLNMKDGCIIGYGKGNDEWNNSAPHGAGRLMSRAKAKQNITLDDFEKCMEGIYTTSVGKGTIDESPFAYKSSNEIIEAINETIHIDKIIKPIYNFKAS